LAAGGEAARRCAIFFCAAADGRLCHLMASERAIDRSAFFFVDVAMTSRYFLIYFIYCLLLLLALRAAISCLLACFAGLDLLSLCDFFGFAN
jgi:hypothetical protein